MTKPNFDEKIDRIGTHSAKWDALETRYGLSPDDGISMWVADMEFKPPQSVLDALGGMVDHGVFGYYGDQTSYLESITRWMQKRHNWTVDPSWIFTTHGLVNGTALCLQTYTEPGDGVILFTPVYHVFSRLIADNNRRLVESPLVESDGRYEMDLDALESQLTGSEKMVIFCSPHNPGGRVWRTQELKAVCDFCIKHDLILVSDEIHHDLVFDGNQHTVMSLVTPEISKHLIMMTAATKTFNMAGGHSGNVIIEDPDLREMFSATMKAMGMSPNSFGVVMTEAAYNGGEQWLGELIPYLDENRRVFDAGINAIPGLRSMELEATYLAWVDFSGTGMTPDAFTDRVQKTARIATNYGPTFGAGGDNFLRFNLACQKAVVEEALARLTAAFSDK
ncbi:MAG: pyridoxal phosphate-dependent aminotransferase [Rhodospirillaceae bacterium]|nr:pyridoxal phosphate-dependent aminotransferase [Rhodospirillaceae bacterium]